MVESGASSKWPVPLVIALVSLAGVLVGVAVAVAVVTVQMSQPATIIEGPQSAKTGMADESATAKADGKEEAVDEQKSDDVNSENSDGKVEGSKNKKKDAEASSSTKSMGLKEAKDVFVGSWDFFSSSGTASEDYLGTFVIREDQTAMLRLLEMGLPDASGGRAITGEGEPQEYSWETTAEGIVLHPQEGTTAFDAKDVKAKVFVDWTDDYWTYIIALDDAYYLGSTDQKKRAGWEKRVDCGEFDVYQVRDMDVGVGDDERCAIRVIGAGYDVDGQAGYLLEVTNKTDEEINIDIDFSASYNNWTIAGKPGPNPDFENRYVAAAAEDGTPTTELVFMGFHPSYSSSDGSNLMKGYDGDLDGLHQVVGGLTISLQDTYEDSSYAFNIE